ncbi:MAG: hypothetical protein ACE15E_20785, partial [Acidobacteriota bacterium]
REGASGASAQSCSTDSARLCRMTTVLSGVLVSHLGKKKGLAPTPLLLDRPVILSQPKPNRQAKDEIPLPVWRKYALQSARIRKEEMKLFS